MRYGALSGHARVTLYCCGRFVKSEGTTETSRPDIARLDNAAPYRKGGHRETCFSVRVDAHLQFYLWLGEYYMSCSSVVCYCSISFYFSFSYVRHSKLASSLVNVWAHYKNSDRLFDWLIGWSIPKSFLCHHCVVLCTVYVFYVRIAHASQNRACPHGTSATPARDATMHTSQQSSEVAETAVADSDAPEVAAAGMSAYLSSSWSSLLLLLLLSTRGCRDSVWAPTEWLTARRNCRRL